MIEVKKSKKETINLEDLKPCYLYISRSNSVLDDKIGGIKKFLKGKINFDTDFKVFDASDDIDEEEFSNFINIPSFFSAKKVVVIKNVEHMPSRLLKMLVGFLSMDGSKNSSIVFIITASSNKLNFKFLDSVGKVGKIKKFRTPLSSNLRKWLKEKSELDGVEFTHRAATVLIESVNLDLNLLKVEYEKLYTYVSSEKEKIVDEKIVKSLVSSTSTLRIFDLIDYIGSRDKNGVLKALKVVLDEKQNLIGAVKLIYRMFKCFLYLKSEGGRELARNYIEKNVNIPSYFINKLISKYIRYSKNYSEAEIIKVFEILNIYDINFRKGEIEDKNLARRLISEIVNVNVTQ